MRKGLLKKIGMILLMTIIVIGGVAVGSKKVKASEVEPRLLEETEHGNCGEPEAYRSSIAFIYEEVYYSFKNGVLTIYGRSDTTKEHVSDYRFIKILNGYFENCTNIEKVVVNVDEIIFGVNAFKGCTNLTTVTMPKGIYSLSTSAFEGCEKLESIIFPDGCRLDNSGISENCFKNCTSLTSIELPSHCNQINTGVFEGCTNLETVVFEEIVDYRGKNHPLYSTPFNECSNLTTIVMKNNNSDLDDDNSITSIKTMIDYAASASSNFSTIKVPHQYADAAREYIENQLEIDLGRSLEKPIDVIAICSVAFDNNGYDTAPDSILTEENTLITAPTPLTDEAKCFAGWYKEATCENAWDFENDLVTEDITLYAKWNDNHNYADVTDSGIHKCVICGKEESHDFTNQSYQPDDFGMHYQKCKYCEAETVHELHIFDKGVVTKEPTVVAEGVRTYTCTLCDRTKEEPIAKLKLRYTISFKGNGSTSGSMKNITAKKDESYTLADNTFKRTGYSFTGWNTKKDGSGKSYANKASVTNLTKTNGATVTLYAQWKINTYKITYKLNGGKNSSKNPKSYKVTSKAITFANPTRQGYTFKGWYSDKKLTKKVSGLKAGSTGDKTIYAKWSANKYTIKYNANGGKGTMKNKSMTYDKKAKLTKNAFTRQGYTFKGWATSKADAKKGKIKYKNAAEVKNLTKKNGDKITLYAVWKKK